MSHKERSRLVVISRVREKAMTINDYKGGIGGDGDELPAGPADIQTTCE